MTLTVDQMETMLAEARQALHRVITQQAEVQIEYAGRKVAYSMTNVAALGQYVRDLEQRLARATGTGRRRAIRVRYHG